MVVVFRFRAVTIFIRQTSTNYYIPFDGKFKHEFLKAIEWDFNGGKRGGVVKFFSMSSYNLEYIKLYALNRRDGNHCSVLFRKFWTGKYNRPRRTRDSRNIYTLVS